VTRSINLLLVLILAGLAAMAALCEGACAEAPATSAGTWREVAPSPANAAGTLAPVMGVVSAAFLRRRSGGSSLSSSGFRRGASAADNF
jgi:hypothetical protein